MKIQDNIASEFDEFSKNYTSDMQKCVPHYDFLLSCFSTGYSKNLSPANILDLGCGNGNVTEQLLRLFPKAHFTLLDASTEMLTICKNRFKDYQISLITSYFNDYKFPTNHFDIIVGGFSLHHCNSAEKQTLFKSIFESLKVNGVFACSDLMIDKTDHTHTTMIKEWKTLVNSNFPDGKKWTWIMEHYDAFDKPDKLIHQLSWLEKVGFKDFQISIKDNHWTHIKAKKK